MTAAWCVSLRCPTHYDPTNRQQVLTYLQENRDAIATGLLYVDESVADMHEMNRHSSHAAVAVATGEAMPGRGRTP